MPLDPQAQAFLDMQAALGFPGYHRLSLEAARSAFLARDRHTPRQAVDRVEEHRTAAGVGVRVYWPKVPAPLPDDRRPAIVFLHGGGWVVGGPDTCDVSCRALANATAGVVVSVDYRLAPEHKFPAQVDDAVDAWKWTIDRASLLGVDPGRVAVAGDSAGANLALVIGLVARDRGEPMPAFQALVYPVADFGFDTPSYREYADGYGLTRAAMQYYWAQYLARPEDGADPYASPLRADLRGLPPAWVAAAEYDPLRSEVEALAARLAEAGVPTALARYNGQIHGFFHLGRVMDRGREALADCATALNRALHGDQPGPTSGKGS